MLETAPARPEPATMFTETGSAHPLPVDERLGKGISIANLITHTAEMLLLISLFLYPWLAQIQPDLQAAVLWVLSPYDGAHLILAAVSALGLALVAARFARQRPLPGSFEELTWFVAGVIHATILAVSVIFGVTVLQ